jgi:glycosyltransferase involved in cell wall biosynthesis
MTQPTATIITATYNSSRTLACTIQSVLAQEFTDFEYLVIGDACTDDSESIVRDFDDPRVRWHNLPSNSRSQAAPNNAGLELARGKYIAYVGHDDLWFPWHLKNLVRTLEDQQADLAHSLSFMIGPDGLRAVQGVLGRGREYADMAAVPSSWLDRRTAQRWRDPNQLAIAVDNDFFWRRVQAGARIVSTLEPSLLKFPSPWWKLYSREHDFPQVTFLGRMQRDPHELLHELLLESAIHFSRRASSYLSLREWLYHGLRPSVVQVLRSNHESALLRSWFQKYRRRIRRLRGLSD